MRRLLRPLILFLRCLAVRSAQRLALLALRLAKRPKLWRPLHRLRLRISLLLLPFRISRPGPFQMAFRLPLRPRLPYLLWLAFRDALRLAPLASRLAKRFKPRLPFPLRRRLRHPVPIRPSVPHSLLRLLPLRHPRWPPLRFLPLLLPLRLRLHGQRIHCCLMARRRPMGFRSYINKHSGICLRIWMKKPRWPRMSSGRLLRVSVHRWQWAGTGRWLPPSLLSLRRPRGPWMRRVVQLLRRRRHRRRCLLMDARGSTMPMNLLANSCQRIRRPLNRRP